MEEMSTSQSDMDVSTDVYGPETLISVHTNKPMDPETNPVEHKPKVLIFWCEVCHAKIQNHVTAIQHLHGRSHKAKSAPGNAEIKVLKRKISGGNDAISNKKSKGQEKGSEDASELNCEVCDKEFATCWLALQHFKGKKHASKMEFIYKQKQVQEKSNDANFKCEHCDREFSSALSAVLHFKGKKHTTKVESLWREKNMPQQSDPSLKCEFCNKAFTTMSLALQHFQGRKHMAVVQSHNGSVPHKIKQEEDTDSSLKCEDCALTFTSDTLALSHFKGKKHASKVASKALAARGRGRGQWNSGYGRGYASFRDRPNSGFRDGPLSLLPPLANNGFGNDFLRFERLASELR